MQELHPESEKAANHGVHGDHGGDADNCVFGRQGFGPDELIRRIAFSMTSMFSMVNRTPLRVPRVLRGETLSVARMLTLPA
jgi:hypothetical protein